MSRSGSVLPTGEQFELRLGDQRAVVTEVGATLRSYSVAGREFLDTFADNQISFAGHGQVLVPWPNRIDGGRYTFQGRSHQAPLNEPEKQNAIHGLVRWLNWVPAAHDAARITLTLRLLMNMMVGHLLLVLFFSATSFFLFTAGGWWSVLAAGSLAFGFAFTLFEILVAVLQAYVFALLTAVYIQLAVAEEH